MITPGCCDSSELGLVQLLLVDNNLSVNDASCRGINFRFPLFHWQRGCYLLIYILELIELSFKSKRYLKILEDILIFWHKIYGSYYESYETGAFVSAVWAENNEFDPTLYRNFNQKSTYSSKTRPKGLSDPKVEEMKEL